MHTTTKTAFNAGLATALLSGAATQDSSADIDVTYWYSYSSVYGDIQDYSSWSGSTTTYDRFRESDNDRSLIDVSSHDLSESGSASYQTFSSNASSSTSASSSVTPYTANLSLGASASGQLVSGWTDRSDYSGYAYQDFRFTPDGTYDMSFSWSSINADSGADNQYTNIWVQDLTSGQIIAGTSTATIRESSSGGFTDVRLEDGHNYRVFLRANAYDASSGDSSSSAHITANIQLTEIAVVPTPAVAVAAIPMLGVLGLRRRRKLNL